MNFMRMIHLAIVFVVAVLLWTILSFLVLPHIKILIPSLPPQALWAPIYKIVGRVSEYLVVAIMVVFTMLWIIWKIINKVLPKILKKMIRWEFSPFKELKRSGIFGLLDALFGAIFSTKSVDKRLKDVGLSIANFVKGSSGMVAEEAIRAMPASARPNQGKGAASIPKTNSPPPSNDPYQPSPLTDDQQTQLDQRYQQCLEENLVTLTSDMSAAERNGNRIKNETAKVNCKLLQLSQKFDTISFRL